MILEPGLAQYVVMVYLRGTTTTKGLPMTQTQIRKGTRRPATRGIDTRSPSGKPLPF